MLSFIKIGFLEIRIWDILDVLLVAVLMYQIYRLLKGSIAFNIFIGFLLVYLLYLLVDLLNMDLLSNILGQFIAAGFLAIFIVFQPEIRRFLLFIGRGTGIGERSFWNRLLSRKISESNISSQLVNSIVRSINNLAKAKLGALIVFTRTKGEYFFADTGVFMDAEISSKLLESIFQKSSPLHDGAVIITGKKIYAAACVLPVSENPNLPPRIGMRHKAAVGISEQVDAIVIVVSEETGNVSLANKGKLRLKISQNVLKESISEILSD